MNVSKDFVLFVVRLRIGTVACIAMGVAPGKVAGMLDNVTWSSTNQEPLRIQRVSGNVVLDGVLQEEAWSLIEPLPMSMYQPAYLGDLTERTDVRVTYDDGYIYVGAALYDSHFEVCRPSPSPET